MQVVPQLETVLDLGGCCDWCDDPLEPGEVVMRAPVSGERIHQDGCLAEDARAAPAGWAGWSSRPGHAVPAGPCSSGAATSAGRRSPERAHPAAAVGVTEDRSKPFGLEPL